MSRYGEALEGDKLAGQFEAREKGYYQFELHPELWAIPAIDTYYGSKTWTREKFVDPAPQLPTDSGIYCFVVAAYSGRLSDHSYIFYVGQAVNIRIRYGEYLLENEGRGNSPRPKVMKFLRNFSDFVFFDYTLVPRGDLDMAEDLLKDNLTPFANTQVKVIGRLKV